MAKWEYCNRGSNNFSDPEFNKLGADGWELVAVIAMPVKTSVLQQQASLVPVWIFKRQLMETVH